MGHGEDLGFSAEQDGHFEKTRDASSVHVNGATLAAV